MVMSAGAAVTCTAVARGNVTLTGPLPVPIGTEQTAREALSPMPQ